MALLTRDESLGIARRVVDASPADETEVTLDSEVESFVRFADVGPTQNADRERVCLSIRVRQRGGEAGYHEARAVCGTADEADWRRALDRALALAGVSPVNEAGLPLPGQVPVPETSADAATLAHGFAAKASWVNDAVRSCTGRGLRPAGLARTGGLSRAIASSAGRAVHGAISRASLSLTASADGGSGFGDVCTAEVGALDPGIVIERAVGKAAGSQRPRDVDTGEFTVVLEPAAVSSILLFASYVGFGAREVEEESSFLCGRIGERVFAEGLTIHDDACHGLFPGLPFDGEGNPKRRVELVHRGRLEGPVTDRHYAQRLGVECSGHAQPQPSVEGPIALNLVVSPGEQSLDELIAGVERGLLVTQFHYTNVIEPRELLLTGMTRNGTFLIEDGEVKHAVKNLRFTDSLVRALAAVSGVGRESEVAGALFEGNVVTPALRIEGFRFTSTTDF